jgi:hypothetical protein
VAEAFRRLDRSHRWRLTDTVDLAFDAGHPQGMARVGDRLFVSSVEVHEPPSARSPGRGVGHLFVVDPAGVLEADVVLGESDAYHPGGIDFDGRWLWVPVAEYRPGTRSIVYRVDPATLAVAEAFRVADHVGGIVRDRVDGRLHGHSWGSRTLYEWTAGGRPLRRRANPSHFVDYQDGHYVGDRTMVCGGVARLAGPGGTAVELGGLALVDLRRRVVLHEVPVQEHSPRTGHVVTRNPVELEATDAGLRLRALPDDGRDAALLVYELSL